MEFKNKPKILCLVIVFNALMTINHVSANQDLATSELSSRSELSYNQASIFIDGNENAAYINQHGFLSSGNAASITQSGNQNKSSINQGGSSNSANIEQYGDANLALILQKGDGNEASILQDGNLNEAVLAQYGSNLENAISQTGDGNSAYIVNSRSVSMSGFDINQTGQNSLIIINGMNRNISMTLK